METIWNDEKEITQRLHGIYPNLTNEQYFADIHFLSSSGLKMLLREPEMFYRKYILKNLPKEEGKEHFDVGTAIHTKILEPEKYENQVTSFDGRRSGKVWEQFKEDNKGKIILGNVANMQVERMYASIQKHKKSLELLHYPGSSELSFFTSINGVPVKTRKDRISFDAKLMLDLKSMSGIINEETFGKQADYLDYDLSAALYMDVANRYLNPLTLVPYGEVPNGINGVHIDKIEDYYWIVSSKDFDDTKVVKASPEILEQGRQKYLRALEKFKFYTENGWKFQDEIIVLYPRKTA